MADSLLHILDQSRRRPDSFKPRQVRQYLSMRLQEQSSSWQVAHVNSCFTRRVTAIRWHPRLQQSVAYGTHAGDIMLWDYTKLATDCPKIEGIGMGNGCITEMRFHPDDPTLIYTTAVDGRFSLQDFEGRQTQVLLDTMTIDFWWCSMDYSNEYGVLMVGDNRGTSVQMDMGSHSVIRKFERLHKGKIKYMEFCPARNWMLVTASIDRTVKFWDIRMFGRDLAKPTPLSSAEHTGLVSSAYFDPIYGTRLLTTAQNGEIRVYDSCDLWRTPTCVVQHSHRNFQHMTDIRATWHPLYEDLCVIGRYPKKEEVDTLRTVDLMDLKSGKRCGYFYSAQLSGIIQLNQFSQSGEVLASGMGYNGLIWKHGLPDAEEQMDHSGRVMDASSLPLSSLLNKQKRRTKSRSAKEAKESKEVRKKKLKLSVKCELSL